MANFRSFLFISDCKQAIDKEYKPKFRKSYPGISKPLMDSSVQNTLRWWAGVGNNRSIVDCISSCGKAINNGAEKELLGLTANPFPHNCTLPESYMCLLAPHENQHLSKISTHSGSSEVRTELTLNHYFTHCLWQQCYHKVT